MKIKANKILAVLCVIAMVMTMIVPMTMTAAAEETTYSHTFASGDFSSSKTTSTLSEKEWTVNSSSSYFGWDSNNGKGLQFGSSGSPATTMTLTSESFDGVTKIVINTSGASNIVGSFTVTVGSKQVGESTTLTKTATDYTFTLDAPASGPIEFVYTQTSSKALYIKSIEVTYGASGGEGGDTPAEPDPTYTATFATPEGVEVEAQEDVSIATMPELEDYNAEYTFAGWAEAIIEDTQTEPTLHTAGSEVTLKDDTTFYAVYSYSRENASGSLWVSKEIGEITATDVVVITMTKGSTTWALSNDKGTGSAPTAVVVNVVGDNITDAVVADNIQWNISNNNGSLTIYPNGSTNKWLYCTNANNGVRVGDNVNNAFTIDATSGYLKNTATSRYVGVYTTNPDWRCYTNTTGNTAGQTLGFFVKTTGVAIETFYTSYPADSDCAHDNTTVIEGYDATCTENGLSDGLQCADCGAILEPQTVITPSEHNYGEGIECTECGKIKPNSTLTIAQALAAGSKMDSGTFTTDKYYVTGVVKEVQSTTYGNMIISDGTNEILIYGVYSADGNTRYDAMTTKPVVGDTVTVYGVLGKYNQTIEFKNTWMTKFIPTSEVNMSLAYKYAEEGGQLVDSMFVLKCGVSAGLANIEGVTSYGIRVTAGDKTVDYTSNANSWTVGNDVISVAIDLGNIIKDTDKLTTDFTVRAFVEVDGVTYESTSTKTYSVADMVAEYYANAETTAQVEHLYNILAGYGLYTA